MENPDFFKLLPQLCRNAFYSEGKTATIQFFTSLRAMLSARIEGTLDEDLPKLKANIKLIREFEASVLQGLDK